MSAVKFLKMYLVLINKTEEREIEKQSFGISLFHGQVYFIKSEVNTLPVKGQGINTLGLVGHTVSISTIQLLLQYISGHKHMKTNDHVPIKFYEGTLKFDFHIIFICHKIFFFFLFFFQPFKT